MSEDIPESFQFLSRKGTWRPFPSQAVVFWLVLAFVSLQNCCLLPHYSCSKFCFPWTPGLCQLFAWSGTGQSSTSLIAFYWWLNYDEVLGFWAESVSPPSCRTDVWLQAMLWFLLRQLEKRKATGKETACEQRMYVMHTDISVWTLARGLTEADTGCRCGSGAAAG